MEIISGARLNFVILRTRSPGLRVMGRFDMLHIFYMVDMIWTIAYGPFSMV